MQQLNYPKNSYEVIVVTDEKETLEADRIKPSTMKKTLAFLIGTMKGCLEPLGSEERSLSLFVLSETALAAFFFPVPYTSAMILKAIGRSPKTWTKTPRTGE